HSAHLRVPPRPNLYPYTTLFRSGGTVTLDNVNANLYGVGTAVTLTNVNNTIGGAAGQIGLGLLSIVNGTLGTIQAVGPGTGMVLDRESARLNSSDLSNSYSASCL